METDILVSWIKEIFIYICIYYVYTKIINKHIRSIKLNISISAFIIVLSLLYTFLLTKYNLFSVNLVCIFIYYLFISIMTQNKLGYSAVVTGITLGLAYGIYAASVFVGVSITSIFNIKNPIVNAVVVGIIQMLLIILMFRIKRFKKGFSFMKNQEFINSFGIIGIILGGIIIIIHPITAKTEASISLSLIMGAIILLFGIIILTKKQITSHYKQTLKEDTMQQLESELEKEKIKNEKATEEIEALSKINHKYVSRIEATEKYINELSKNMNTEFSEELVVAKDLVDNLSKDFNKEISDNIKINSNIEKTKIVGIDSVISYFESKTKKDNIDFVVKVNCDMNEFLNNTTEQSKIETILSDHIKDAMIAINYGNKTDNKIKLEFNKKDEYFEIRILDTGIEFETNTLVILGTERVTTHKNSGGSGIGFMTTFETLKECKGSLIIEEYEESSNEYSKAIIIRFDGKDEYKIHSYRAEQIKKKDKKKRIIIEK